MSHIFIGGSRRISRLHRFAAERLDRLLYDKPCILVGDANGADRAVQRHLKDRGYENVEVVCSGSICRNNEGRWPEHHVAEKQLRKDFNYYAIKDQTMTDRANFGIMIWDGESFGTFMNIWRLHTQGKIVEVYYVPEKRWITIDCPGEWQALCALSSSELRARLERVNRQQRGHRPAIGQPSLL